VRIPHRLVVDTNVFVSAIILPRSSPRQVVDRALDQGLLLLSDATVGELREVLSRSKLDRYVSREERALVLAQIGRTAEFVPIIQLVRQCRDLKDDKFLEIALNGRADVIITGDADLLTLHPWRGIEILSPKQFLRT